MVDEPFGVYRRAYLSVDSKVDRFAFGVDPVEIADVPALILWTEAQQVKLAGRQRQTLLETSACRLMKMTGRRLPGVARVF